MNIFHVGIQRGGGEGVGGPDPLKKYQNIGGLAILV